ncbi:MAG: hypothetical protein BAJATHORv1_20129 [Candidatus Thorarchaeota archaeon]|nr:MAG: hypothetical protein BAJATHORv1_20129 [Candidatus Thorarchaeota archaeon]
MQDYDLVNWLVNNASTTVKFRTLIDIINEPDIGEVGRTFSVLQMEPAIVELVESIPDAINYRTIHSDAHHSFENIMGILFQIGIRAGMQLFDLKTLPYRVWLKNHTKGRPIDRQIVCAFLALTGYGQIGPVIRELRERLIELYDHRKEPSVYDIIGLTHCSDLMNDDFQRDKIEEIVFRTLQKIDAAKETQITHPDFTLSGLLVQTNNKPSKALLAFELLAPLWVVQNNRWFRNGVRQLEKYRTRQGTYHFPEDWLKHKEDGYWVGGDYMAMNLQERTQAEIECESTFRALRIRQLGGLLRTG